MMEKKKLVPKRRFQEFSDCWEQKLIEDISEVNSGRDYKHLQKGNIPVYGTGGYMLSVNDKLSIKDGIGIGRKGTIDKPQYLKAPFWTVDTLFYMIPKENLDIYFFYSKSRDIKWKYLDESTGVPSLSRNTINNIELYLPTYQEQQKIGEFFKVLDDRITNQERKIAKVKALKSAYLTEMFPQEGETVPRRRYRGFESEWRTQLLKNVSDVRDGTHDSPKYYSEGYPFITSKNVSEGYINYENVQYISEVDFNRINKRSKVDMNDILMGMIGTVGNIALIRKEPYFAIKNVALIKDTNQVNQLYLYYFFQSVYFKKQLIDGMDGGTQRFISLYKIRNLTILTPDREEQQKIGQFFKNLDDQIATEEKKLEKLKKMKEAYLEEMFV